MSKSPLFSRFCLVFAAGAALALSAAPSARVDLLDDIKKKGKS